MSENSVLKHSEITEKILHAFFKKVYHKLGYGFLITSARFPRLGFPINVICVDMLIGADLFFHPRSSAAIRVQLM